MVRDSLRLFVNRQKLSQGDRLPSEIALAKEFGVSRTVLRETYRLLERDGVIVVKGGAGTFLGGAITPVKNTLNDLMSTGTLIREAGFLASAEILELTKRDPEPEWAEKLDLKENQKVIAVKRLRKADDTVIAMAWNIFIEEEVGDTLERGILEDSIFVHLEKECGLKIASAVTSISALNPNSPYDEEALKTLGDLALLLKRLHLDLSGRPIFYSLDYIRTDLVELIVRQQRNFY
ncbi:MAG: GntR family transcriptional regulator [Deltaproteobacteria bacterium]|jgi:GntR family transcriptional regulator|nr:GntR family transcriptional regulator [Deltaproteobacteria bacterium]